MEKERASYVRIGWLATAGWVLFCGAYVTATCGWPAFVAMPANEFGDFLAGAFAPLAFFWLALGLLVQAKQLELQRSELSLQRRELELQREETARLANEARRQADAIAVNELHMRKDTFSRLRELVSEQLAELVYEVAVSLEGLDRIKRVSAEWGTDRISAAKRIVLGQLSISNRSELTRRLSGSMVWRRDFATYCNFFETLLRDAELADATGSLRYIVEHSTDANIYVGFTVVLGDRQHQLQRSDTLLDQLLGMPVGNANPDAR